MKNYIFVLKFTMKKYGCIGKKLTHSFSKEIHETIAEYTYELIEVAPEALAAFMNERTFKAINVTIPYKQKVMDYLEGLSDGAKEIDAVNVVKVTHENEGKAHLQGFNSDVIGFTRSIEELVKDKHRKALILGTGGASKAIAYSLKQLGIEYLFVSRNAGEQKIAYSDITKEIMETHTLIVNCTPLGMVGHGIDQCPDIPYEMLGEGHLLYDIVYNPENTLFLQKGAARGATAKSGYEMWYLQALASWDIWNK